MPRRRLRTELRRARAEVGLTQDQVAAAMDWSLSKVIRIENGTVSISTNDLRVLLNLYQIQDRPRVDDLVELARASRQPSWWGKHRGVVSAQYLQYIEYEEAATVLRSYQSTLLPGLLRDRGIRGLDNSQARTAGHPSGTHANAGRGKNGAAATPGAGRAARLYLYPGRSGNPAYCWRAERRREADSPGWST